MRATAAKDDVNFYIDEDDEYPAVEDDFRRSRVGTSGSRWAVEEEDISISPSARAAATAAHAAQSLAGRGTDDDDEDAWDDLENGWSQEGGAASRSSGRGSGFFSADPQDSRMKSRGDLQTASPRSASPSWADEDIIADGGHDWFENDEDWYEPEYSVVDAPPGSVLEKVQRIHLREPKDFTFEDGEYFDLTGFVKDNTDNQFALVLEVAERARERRLEHLEAAHPIPISAALPPIQQAIVDLALEIEASGGKTSAFSAMREAADRARLRWELQEASWAWDNYCEDQMKALGVSERAARLLHMGQRVEDAMDFEKDLNAHEDEYDAKPPRS